jgi:hypothetical protein
LMLALLPWHWLIKDRHLSTVKRWPPCLLLVL